MTTDELKANSKQGAHHPNAAEIEPENRKLDQHPHQTAEVPYGSGDRPEPSGKGGMESQDAAEQVADKAHTSPIRKN